jgi:hypothetical protein
MKTMQAAETEIGHNISGDFYMGPLLFSYCILPGPTSVYFEPKPSTQERVAFTSECIYL